MKILMPDYVQAVINTLISNGYEAYAVGGCIRDVQLLKVPADWDITTSATPQEMLKVFSNEKVIPTGLKHGTITLVVDGHNLEITTFRIDGNYSDNRHPEAVEFTNLLTEDLKRRDFTINTLAYNDTVGIVDCFNGVNDIKTGIIRCVGNPDVRFNEDALRIMRAIRFSSVLGFSIDTETKKSIFRNAQLLRNVSSERVFAELSKLLCGKNVTKVLIEYRDVIGVIIPELKETFDFNQNNKHHIYSIYDHIAYAVGYGAPKLDIRLALLLHDIGKPACYTEDEKGVGHFYGHGRVGSEIAAPILKRLRLPNDMYNDVTNLILYHDCPITPDKKSVKRNLSKYGEPLLRKILEVKIGDSLAHNTKYGKPTQEIQEINRLIDEVVADNECFSLKGLAVCGTDLIQLGVERGPNVGALLNELLRMVIDGKLENDKEVLLARVQMVMWGEGNESKEIKQN